LTQAGIKIAPSTFYARINRTPSMREKRDRVLTDYLIELFEKNFYVYGARKLHAVINQSAHRQSHAQGPVARCTVERLMRQANLKGLIRRKNPNTTYSVPKDACPLDLVDRAFTATRPNQLWVADITYVRTWSGWVYTAFVTDVYSRKIVGWKISDSLYAELAVDALTMAISARQRAGHSVAELVHHSDRGVQYRSISYATALEDNEIVASVGSRGDSYDNALAEAVNSLYKGELIHNTDVHPGGWHGLGDVERATADWVGWYNTERVHSRLGNRSPQDFEDLYWGNFDSTAAPAA
jgi:putative transposase